MIIDYTELMETAKKSLENSYSPYSEFKVGAALLACDGTIYSGCNIENAAYTPTVCAERVAFFKAVCDGRRSGDLKAIAIVASKNGKFTRVAPCGVCRQVMREFCHDDFEIIMLGDKDEKQITRCTLGEILPLSFMKDDVL